MKKLPAFVERICVVGMLKAGNENVKEIWSETLGSPVFRETHFEFLTLCSVQ
jgi:hypothetical protein